MKKKILSLLVVATMTLGLVGCASEERINTSRFATTGEKYQIDGGNYKVVVDRETKNLYLVSTTDKTVMPLYDANGNIAKDSK